MNFQSFSQTYWYVWLIVALLIIIICLLNGFGMYLYGKKRRNFLHQDEKDTIPMSETSPTPTGKYRLMSSPSTNSDVFPISSFVAEPSPVKTSNPSKSIFSLNTTMEKSEMDLGLEQFQRQALMEHNTMRAMYKKSSLKLSEELNLYAQYWAEHCARTNVVVPSRSEWRSMCKNDHIGENIIHVCSSTELDGHHFTALIMAKGNHSSAVDCVLNELTTEVGFGRAQIKQTNSSEQQWIAVAHYYPYRPLPHVQS